MQTVAWEDLGKNPTQHGLPAITGPLSSGVSSSPLPAASSRTLQSEVITLPHLHKALQGTSQRPTVAFEAHQRVPAGSTHTKHIATLPPGSPSPLTPPPQPPLHGWTRRVSSGQLENSDPLETQAIFMSVRFLQHSASRGPQERNVCFHPKWRLLCLLISPLV